MLIFGGDVIPRLCLRHLPGRHPRHLFFGLRGQEPGAVHRAGPGRQAEEVDHEFADVEPESMRLTEVSYGSARAIEGYGPGFFRVAGHVLRGACLITPWDAGPLGRLDDTAAPLALAGRSTCCFLHGGRNRAPARCLPAGVEAAGIGVEVMNSRGLPHVQRGCWAKGGASRLRCCQSARALRPARPAPRSGRAQTLLVFGADQRADELEQTCHPRR